MILIQFYGTQIDHDDICLLDDICRHNGSCGIDSDCREGVRRCPQYCESIRARCFKRLFRGSLRRNSSVDGQAIHPGGKLIARDLTKTELAPVTAQWVGAAYTPEESRSAEQRQIWAVSDSLIAELEAANEYVIGVYLLYGWAGFLYIRRLWYDLGRLQPNAVGFLLDHATTLRLGGPNAIPPRGLPRDCWKGCGHALWNIGSPFA